MLQEPNYRLILLCAARIAIARAKIEAALEAPMPLVLEDQLLAAAVQRELSQRDVSMA